MVGFVLKGKLLCSVCRKINAKLILPGMTSIGKSTSEAGTSLGDDEADCKS